MVLYILYILELSLRIEGRVFIIALLFSRSSCIDFDTLSTDDPGVEHLDGR
jgi:hypothetical protein